MYILSRGESTLYNVMFSVQYNVYSCTFKFVCLLQLLDSRWYSKVLGDCTSVEKRYNLFSFLLWCVFQGLRLLFIYKKGTNILSFSTLGKAYNFSTYSVDNLYNYYLIFCVFSLSGVGPPVYTVQKCTSLAGSLKTLSTKHTNKMG